MAVSKLHSPLRKSVPEYTFLSPQSCSCFVGIHPSVCMAADCWDKVRWPWVLIKLREFYPLTFPTDVDKQALTSCWKGIHHHQGCLYLCMPLCYDDTHYNSSDLLKSMALSPTLWIILAWIFVLFKQSVNFHRIVGNTITYCRCQNPKMCRNLPCPLLPLEYLLLLLLPSPPQANPPNILA